MFRRPVSMSALALGPRPLRGPARPAEQAPAAPAQPPAGQPPAGPAVQPGAHGEPRPAAASGRQPGGGASISGASAAGSPAGAARARQGQSAPACAAPATARGMPAAAGSGGPNLLRSQLVLDDKDAELIIPSCRRAAPVRADAALPVADEDVKAIAAWLHSLQAQGTNQGGPPPDRDRAEHPGRGRQGGEAFFAAQCASCHSPTGDLQGLATRAASPMALQNMWVSGGVAPPRGARRAGPPPASKPVMATVTLASGEKCPAGCCASTTSSPRSASRTGPRAPSGAPATSLASRCRIRSRSIGSSSAPHQREHARRHGFPVDAQMSSQTSFRSPRWSGGSVAAGQTAILARDLPRRPPRRSATTGRPTRATTPASGSARWRRSTRRRSSSWPPGRRSSRRCGAGRPLGRTDRDRRRQRIPSNPAVATIIKARR